MILITDRKVSSHDNNNMKITPLDIRKKEFSIKLRGLDRDEVHSFLLLVREQMEELSREMTSLKEEGARREKELKGYKEIESELQNTVICTHQMVEKYKQATEKELDIILTDAMKRGKRIIEEAEKKSIRLHEEIAHLKDMRRNLQLELKLMINGHMKMLENIDNIEEIADLKKRHIREEDKRQFVA